MNPEQQLLVMMLGVPGAGKSEFARGLSDRLSMKRITADAVRSQLFGSINAGRTPENHRRTYEVVNEQMAAALQDGHSVVRDNQNNCLADREMCRTLAQEVGARAVIVWMQTPREVAIQRCMDRDDLPDQLKLDEATSEEFHASSLRALEEPAPNEDCIQIDGTLSFDLQFAAFARHMGNAQTPPSS